MAHAHSHHVNLPYLSPNPTLTMSAMVSRTVHNKHHKFSRAEMFTCEACSGCTLLQANAAMQATAAMQGTTAVHILHHGFSCSKDSSKSSSMRHHR